MATRQRRTRGYIRKRGNSFQVLVYAGPDPLTGKDVYLTESTNTERDAERIRTRLLAQADKQRSASTRATLGFVLDAWLHSHDVDPGTAASYRRTVDKRIRPALGHVPVSKVTPRMLEEFYAELRRCRDRCEPATRVAGHVCRPYAAGTIRETHSIISGALSAAVRWEWIASNPADATRKPKAPKPNPDPPSPDEAARIVRAAMGSDPDWGLLVWFAMITGARRGEVCALRWRDVDLTRRSVEIRRNVVDGVEKHTKTHQIRRIALDEATTTLLTEHQIRCSNQLALFGLQLGPDEFVFSNRPDYSRWYDPDAVSHRFRAMCRKLGINSHLHALRHYAATELISAGVDVRTVAGRLGHGGGGTTTLRVYTAWVPESDKRAAEILAARLAPRDHNDASDAARSLREP